MGSAEGAWRTDEVHAEMPGFDVLDGIAMAVEVDVSAAPLVHDAKCRAHRPTRYSSPMPAVGPARKP